jgi:hypothetical protein
MSSGVYYAALALLEDVVGAPTMRFRARVSFPSVSGRPDFTLGYKSFLK